MRLSQSNRLLGNHRAHPPMNRAAWALRVVWILASLLLIAGAIVWLANNQQKNEERVQAEKALEISEFGLMACLQNLGEKPSWTGETPKTPYDDGWYCVKASRYVNGDTVMLRVESAGHFGPISKKQQCALRLSVVKGDSVWTRMGAR